MVREKVLETIADFLYLDSSEVDEETNLDLEYALTDDDMHLLKKRLETLFDIEIDDADFDNFGTVGEIIDYIENEI